MLFYLMQFAYNFLRVCLSNLIFKRLNGKIYHLIKSSGISTLYTTVVFISTFAGIFSGVKIVKYWYSSFISWSNLTVSPAIKIETVKISYSPRTWRWNEHRSSDRKNTTVDVPLKKNFPFSSYFTIILFPR